MTSLTLDGPRWLTRVVAVAEPALASAVILNEADWRPIWMNEPFLSDFVSNFRVTPSVCSIVILASGTGFPWASTTVPVIMPCAAAGSEKPRTTKLTSANRHANRLEIGGSLRTLLRKFLPSEYRAVYTRSAARKVVSESSSWTTGAGGSDARKRRP